MERKYSVSEIDRMRESVTLLLGINPYFLNEQLDRKVENRLRTYLVAGASPKDLDAEARAAFRKTGRGKPPTDKGCGPDSIPAQSG